MTDAFTMKDSGSRREFPTGAVRDQSAGKGRYDLIPTLMLRRWAEMMERGAVKYGDNNWQKGMPLKAFLDSAFRHLTQLAEGDRSEDHAAAVLFNVAGLEWTLEQIKRTKRPLGLAEGTPFHSQVMVGWFQEEGGELEATATVGKIDQSGHPGLDPDWRFRTGNPVGESHYNGGSCDKNSIAPLPNENAYQHRTRVNRPWTAEELKGVVEFENLPCRTPESGPPGGILTGTDPHTLPMREHVYSHQPDPAAEIARLESLIPEDGRPCPKGKCGYQRQPDDFSEPATAMERRRSNPVVDRRRVNDSKVADVRGWTRVRNTGRRGTDTEPYHDLPEAPRAPKLDDTPF